jgi:hypothetical protein
MPGQVDDRIPVVFAAEAEDGDAVLAERHGLSCDPRALADFSADPPSGHPVACACCAPRGMAAKALTGLFFSRARGEIPFFRRVVAITQSDAGVAAVRTAVLNDPLASARFRLG